MIERTLGLLLVAWRALPRWLVPVVAIVLAIGATVGVSVRYGVVPQASTAAQAPEVLHLFRGNTRVTIGGRWPASCRVIGDRCEVMEEQAR